MKIIYLIHQFLPEHYQGTEKFILNTATYMQKLGHEVKVITMSSYSDSDYNKRYKNILWKEFIYNDIPILALKRKEKNWQHFSNDTNMEKFAERVFNKEKPDVLHIAHTMRVVEFAIVAMKYSIPYVMTLTDFYLMCPRSILVNTNGNLCYGPDKGKNCKEQCPVFSKKEIAKRYWLGKKILYYAKQVVAPSDFLANLFRKEFPHLNIRVIHYGVDTSYIRTNTKKYQQGDQLTFCYAGSIEYHKGVDLLIKAFSKINSERAVLKLYGKGNKQIIHEAKKHKNIQYCGVYNEHQLGEIFSNVDLLVVTSIWHENRPQVINEALASHLPVLASDMAGITEQIKHGEKWLYLSNWG
ncbi:MAG: glycosyltransferase [Bacillus sp. (in: Bacteria)]|nr:glycosyltransferase [Bacillus sp. (in: firmicutes)]